MPSKRTHKLTIRTKAGKSDFRKLFNILSFLLCSSGFGSLIALSSLTGNAELSNATAANTFVHSGTNPIENSTISNSVINIAGNDQLSIASVPNRQISENLHIPRPFSKSKGNLTIDHEEKVRTIPKLNIEKILGGGENDTRNSIGFEIQNIGSVGKSVASVPIVKLRTPNSQEYLFSLTGLDYTNSFEFDGREFVLNVLRVDSVTIKFSLKEN